jgi:hypothetical protein
MHQSLKNFRQSNFASGTRREGAIKPHLSQKALRGPSFILGLRLRFYGDRFLKKRGLSIAGY